MKMRDYQWRICLNRRMQISCLLTKRQVIRYTYKRKKLVQERSLSKTINKLRTNKKSLRIWMIRSQCSSLRRRRYFWIMLFLFTQNTIALRNSFILGMVSKILIEIWSVWWKTMTVSLQSSINTFQLLIN